MSSNTGPTKNKKRKAKWTMHIFVNKSAPKTALEKANAVFIHYPRLEELHKKICRCQKVSRMASEPECMALEGVTGAGKTTLVRDHYASQFSRVETPNGTIIPVLYVEMPSPATVKTAASSLLEAMGDPAAFSGTTGALDSRLAALIKDCGVELVIIDEFSNLIDTETDRVMAKVSDWLKMLIKRTGIPFLVVGIEGKVERILRSNDQLSRLFAMRESIEPFRWDPRDKSSIESFNYFITACEKCIGTPLTKSIHRADMIYRIHFATKGVVGNIMNLLRYAVVLSEELNQSKIELPVLAQAFNERLSKHVRILVNPFSAPCDSTFSPPHSIVHTDSSGAKEIGRRIRISEALSAK
jgi:hypothetical protein